MSALICSGCGHQNGAEDRFCSQCGVRLGWARAAEGSLKTVSVVFCDLVGSTTLQETLEPESARHVMGRFYDVMRAAVELHGGTVERFIGDAVLAAFGAHTVGEDDALRAVRCAAEMGLQVDLLNQELEERWGVRLQVRTGVNTGELVVDKAEILVGDMMNTAARLEQAAAPGDVLIGEPTWRLVRHDVELEEVVPLELKGKREPVRAWRLVSARARVSVRAKTPLIGRSEELSRLRSALSSAMSTRTCRLVTVIGSPGLGKSRLAQEFARELESEATVLVGHCAPSGEGITFLPAAEVLRSAASIGEGDSAELVVEKLSALLRGTPEWERAVARAAALLGTGDHASPEETFWGVRRVLECLAKRAPLVVVLDDLHWGESLFMDLVEHLVEWVREAPILLVALARPELRETREALTHPGSRSADVIELEPFGPEQSRELVAGLLGSVDLPDELLERILDTTDGNPLFLEELLRMLVDEGSLERSGDTWMAVGGADAVQVPPTIQALLTARIERLRADERAVVERAAVIGKQFYRGAVAELVAPPIKVGIDGHLETLRRKDVVQPEGTYWIDEPIFRFHHVLIRDAAYHLLLKEARAELHEKFAEWLEGKAGALVGEHEEVIAYHLEQAHEYRRQLGPLDERGRTLGAHAASRLASAGRRALAREDLAAAANLLRRALARQSGIDEATILWDLGEALLSAGETAGATEVVELLAAVSAGDEGPTARAAVLAAQLAILTGAAALAQTVTGIGTATQALAAAGDGVGEAKGYHVMAQAHAQLGQVAAAETALDRALTAARKVDDRRRITAVLAAAPRAALWGPSPVMRASGRCLDVVRILRMTPGSRHVEPIALRCQAVLEAMRGRAAAARDILDAGRATLEELGLTLELHELAMHAGIVELIAGEHDAASDLLRSARDGFASLGVFVNAAQAAALLGRALVEKGQDAAAIEQTKFAEEHAGGDLKTTITWQGVRAEALARGGSWDEALELARRSADLAEPTDALADKADANMVLARVYRESKRFDDTSSAAEAARVLYQSKGHVVGMQRAGELARSQDMTSPGPTESESLKDAAIDDPELADYFARFAALVEERDIEGLLEMYTEDSVVFDHREIGWGERVGREAHEEVFRSGMEMCPDLRFHIDEVLACEPGTIAIRTTWRGTGPAGVQAEIPMGRICWIEGGLMTRLELFDPDDYTSIVARFEEELGGRDGKQPRETRERPPMRFWAECNRRLATQETGPLLELFPEGARALVSSALSMMSEVQLEVDEVLACDDRVMAMRAAWRGKDPASGGDLERPVGVVSLIEGGRLKRIDQYEPAERQLMTARYAELGGGLGLLGDTASERQIKEYARRYAARDFDGLRALNAEDWRLVDHRQLGWRELDQDNYADEQRAIWAQIENVHLEVNEVLAADDRVLAATGTFRGTAKASAGGGRFDYPVGFITLVENGLTIHSDWYDPDDRHSLLARYHELGGSPAGLRG